MAASEQASVEPYRAPAVRQAVHRLVVGERIREATGLVRPLRLRRAPRRARLAERLLDGARARTDGPARSRWVRLVRAWGVGALLLSMFGAWRWRRRPLAAVVRALVDHEGRARPAVLVTSTDSESWTVRASLFLRQQGRHLEAVEVLDRRVAGGSPSPRARAWLAEALRGAGEPKAAEVLDPPGEARTAPATPRPPVDPRHGLVMLTMFDSDVFRASLASLVASDYPGRIVVVEDGLRPEASCRAACEAAGVDYVKCDAWRGSAAAVNEGLRRMGDATEVVLFAHNDLLWPRTWFGGFDAAWRRALATDRVGLINLSYLQFKRRESALTTLFLQGAYRDLRWLLRAIRETPELMGSVQEATARPGEHPFGLGRDPWNDWMPELRQMTGRFSVAVSFPYATWRELGGFDESAPYGFDLELQRHAIRRRRWILTLDNEPVIHLASADTRALSPESQQVFREKVQQTYARFEEREGVSIDHFVNLFFGEATVTHRDAIVAAANRFAFAELDGVLDEFEQRLATVTRASCELTWCRSWTTCRYA